MSGENFLSQRDILLRVIGSGINISPNALKLIFKAKVNNSDIEELIKNISFVKGFKSHITLEVLKQTKYAKLVKNFKVREKKKEISSTTDQLKTGKHGNNEQSFSKTRINSISKEESMVKVDQNTNNTKPPNKNPNTDSINIADETFNNNKSREISNSDNKFQVNRSSRKNKIIESELDSLKSLTSDIDDTKVITDNTPNSPTALNGLDSLDDTDFPPEEYFEEPELLDTIPITKNDEEGSEETNATTEKIGNNYLDLKSLKGFKPIASEYDPEIKILSDPNKYLYTSGTIEEFVELMNDRYEKLAKILQKNPEANGYMKIRNVNSLQNSCDVEIIGMVKEKRTTGEARHFKLTLEDPTGEIDVLVYNNERNTELYNKMIYLTTDQVVFISGFLKINSQRKSKIIFANKIIWPQVPISHRPKIPESPVSIAYISDVHIGSKNFMPKLFDRFIKYLNCEIGSDNIIQEAGKIKYLVIGGDLVDGIGIYPNQESELNITNIYGQFKESANLLSKIPDYIKIIYIPGNHEPVRNALPHPNVPKKYCKELLDLGVIMSGNPSTFDLHGIRTLCFHGDSLIDLIQQIPGLNNDNPEKAMIEYIRSRHLAPIFGGKTELAPINRDWLVMDEIPHVFHTGHVHINGIGAYRGILNINSGCFQSQTSFMKSLGINPTPGRPIVVSPNNGKLDVKTIDLTQ